MKKLLRPVLLAVCFSAPLALTAQTMASSDTILSQAQADAARQHKVVLVVFRATWCKYCHQFESYLDSPDIRPIVERYFVVAQLNALEGLGKHPERNTPGAEKLLKQYGGSDGLPFFAFLDGSGPKIVDSNAPKIGSIGFPVQPGEIDWFMKMVAKAAPSMTSEEMKILESRLRNSTTPAR
jgi:thioredoxin-related protein